MRFSHFFIERPIFATVVSVLITILGAAAYTTLSVARYPEIAPPTIVVSASYPGASADVIAKTVATPLEQEINGVEDMLYMLSQSTADGRLSLTITFELGTDLDKAQVLVQNRVTVAEPRLPEEVRRIGVTVRKNSPDMLMVVHLTSPDGSRDQVYLSNYATLQIKDVLSRLDGVGEVRVFGSRDYSMRIWLDPDRMEARQLNADQVLAAIRGQNVQVASGVLNQPPVPEQGAFQINVETLGRLTDPAQFGNILVKEGDDGQVTYLRDVARIQLGALDYSANGYLDDQVAVPILILQLPGSNALETAESVLATMAELSTSFPEGLRYDVVYNPTEFIAQSIDAVKETILEAIVLVVIVVIVFLQTWRASIIPIVAIPVSLIGTFAVMAALGYSVNTLTMFGLVLAIGIVVDDAIVVVENIERSIAGGMSPKDAAHHSMDEVSGALIATSLVLLAVFIPAALISGITGQFYRQFAVTIAASTAISTLVSLTLSPALAALVLKPRHEGDQGGGPGDDGAEKRDFLLMRPVHAFFRSFNRAFDRLARGYGAMTRLFARRAALVLLVYGGLIALTAWQFETVPTGFIPEQDQGYLITVVQLPPGASLARTDAVVREASELALGVDGIEHTVPFAGFDGATFTNAPNAGAIFTPLAPFDERAKAGLSADAIVDALMATYGTIQDALIFVVKPPPVRGIGTSGGFKMMVQDQRERGLPALEEVTQGLVAAANQDPEVTRVFSLFNTRTPKVFADIDRVKAQMLGVTPEEVFSTLEVYIGSTFVNEFNYLGRTFRVTAQADAPFRMNERDVSHLRVRNADGDMVPIGSIATFREITGPYRVPRYNLFSAAAVQGAPAPGVSTGEALAAMERLAADVLPEGFGVEWTELAYQEKAAEGGVLLIFAASVVFVFLVLAAQYESWLLPLSVILIVPMCLLAAMTGIIIRGLDNNILVQIGLVVLVGLAAKNAILIVEFARQGEEQGMDRIDAVVHAARTRLRPILMTSFAFIFGVVPLLLAQGAGAEMRRALGTTVFSGMLGVTLFGLLFTPVFYVVCKKFAREPRRAENAAPAPGSAE